MTSISSLVQSDRLALAGRAVLLATDASEGSSGAIHVALALAAEHHAVIHVVRVVDTRSAAIPPPLDLMLTMGDSIGGAAVFEEQLQLLRAELSGKAGRAIDWPAQVLMGNPAETIVAEAKRVGAALIVVGLRRHGKIDRAVHDETAHKVMERAECPVLGVVAGTTALPARVVVALDFSPTSLLAAQSAFAVAGAGARMALVHVASSAMHSPESGENRVHDLGVEAAFANVLADLAGQGLRTDHLVLHGEQRSPEESILKYAESVGADLIAAGSARHARMERWLLGSVSAGLVHDGRRSVLIVPPPSADRGARGVRRPPGS